MLIIALWIKCLNCKTLLGTMCQLMLMATSLLMNKQWAIMAMANFIWDKFKNSTDFSTTRSITWIRNQDRQKPRALILMNAPWTMTSTAVSMPLWLTKITANSIASIDAWMKKLLIWVSTWPSKISPSACNALIRFHQPQNFWLHSLLQHFLFLYWFYLDKFKVKDFHKYSWIEYLN